MPDGDGAPVIPERPTVEQQPGALERVAVQLEQRSRTPEAAERSAPATPFRAPAAAPVVHARPQPVTKTPLREDVEAALADGRLRTLYASLPPNVQVAFRAAAEKLAARLEAMLADGVLDPRELDEAHRGILRWLHTIPEVHRWFLTQEAKVKTDALLAIAARL